MSIYITVSSLLTNAEHTVELDFDQHALMSEDHVAEMAAEVSDDAIDAYVQALDIEHLGTLGRVDAIEEARDSFLSPKNWEITCIEADDDDEETILSEADRGLPRPTSTLLSPQNLDSIEVRRFFRDLQEMAEAVDKLDDMHHEGTEVVATFIREYGSFTSDAVDEYRGSYTDTAVFGEEFADAVGLQIPDQMLPYFDFKTYGADMLTDMIHDEDTGHTWWVS
jgi:hypothetical protein